MHSLRHTLPILALTAALVLVLATGSMSQSLPIFSCGELPAGAGLPRGSKGLVDRFNTPWQPSAALIAPSRQRHLQGSDCSPFRIDYEDVIAGSGIGFDDHTPVIHPILGATTLGELRRRTVCEVFTYIASIIDIKGSPDVIIRASQTDGSGFLAAASPFFRTSAPGFIGGTLFDHITTGLDPTPNPGDYDAMIIYDFGPWVIGGRDYPINCDWSVPSGGEIDLYSITLHEATHALGFLSLIDPSGNSRIGGAFSIFDKRLRDRAASPLVDGSSYQFASTPGELLSGGIIFQGEHCGEASPVFSPNPYQSGSSISHFDSYRSGIRYVMRPSTSGGDDRVYTEPELQVLCDLGYTMKGGICSSCAPRGVDDYGATNQGVEVCIDVLANDISLDGGLLSIDPASVAITAGGGSFVIKGDRLCYTPAAGFIGVARLSYAPTNGVRRGSIARVIVDVSEKTPLPPDQRKDAYCWYFGTYAGIAFGSGSPLPLTDGAMITTEGCATICNRASGALLFYTDGITVWDRSHQAMPNGTKLLGHSSSTQSAIIVPAPGDTNIYYIFTAGALYPADDPSIGIRYSVVDMRLHEGRGDVTGKNILLLAAGTEKLTATRHCNGRDYWVVSHEWGTDRFYSWLLDSSGIAAPVISAIGPVYVRDANDRPHSLYSGVGMIKLSPTGRKLVAGNSYFRMAELFDFDKRTGVISNRMVLDSGRYDLYAVAFSPDESKLYAENLISPTSLYQFDLSAGDIASIHASMREIPLLNPKVPGGQMQLGPDGKIYASFHGQASLGVITSPNKRAPDCNFIWDGVSLGGHSSQQGLPNLIDCDLFATRLDSSALRISKRVSDSIPRYGDTITYTVAVCNRSLCGDATGVVIEDLLPAGLRYVDGMSAYPRHTFDTIRSGDCRSVAIRAVVTSEAPMATRITNCAVIIASQPGFGYVPLDSNCATIMLHGTDLGIAKSVDREEALHGERLIYTVTVTNYGPEEATNAVVRDLLPAGLGYLSSSVTGGGAAYDPATGALSIPLLKVGESTTLEIVCAVAEEAGTTVTNCAELALLDQTDLDLTNNRSCVTLPVADCRTPIQFIFPGFGEVSCCGDSSMTILLENICRGSAEITAIIIPTSPEYSVTLPALPITLASTGTLRLPIRFRPGRSGRVDDSLRLVVFTPESGATDTITIPLHGAGVPLNATARIRHDNRAYPGDVIETPIELLSPLDCAGVQRLQITLAYDTTMIILKDGDYPVPMLRGSILDRWFVEKLENRRGIWSIILHAPNGSSPLTGTGLLLTQRLQFYLGSHQESELAITVTPLGNECATITSESGIAQLDSLCGLSLRLIEAIPGAKLAIGPVRPNPVGASASIPFSTIFDGPVRLDLIDIAGGNARTLLDGYLVGGAHELILDGNNLPAGAYLCRLRSGDDIVTMMMVVVK